MKTLKKRKEQFQLEDESIVYVTAKVRNVHVLSFYFQLENVNSSKELQVIVHYEEGSIQIRGHESIAAYPKLILALKKWFIEEYRDYLFNQQTYEFSTGLSTIRADFHIKWIYEPYKFDVVFPKRFIDDEPVKTLHIIAPSGEPWTYTTSGEGKDVYNVLLPQIKDKLIIILNKIVEFEKAAKEVK